MLVGGYNNDQYFDDVWTWIPYDGEWVQVRQYEFLCQIVLQLVDCRITQLHRTFVLGLEQLLNIDQILRHNFTSLRTAMYA